MIVAMVLVASILIFGVQTTAEVKQAEKAVSARADPISEDIWNIYQSHRYTPIAELLRSPERYAAVTRLVAYLRDPGARGRAWDVLTIIQPEVPGSPDEYEKWKKWLDELRSPIETRAYSEALQDIDILRSRMEQRNRKTNQPLTRKDIKESTQFYRDVKGLIEYFRHPSYRIRLYAYMVLTNTQPDCPGGPNTPDIWENWLMRVEAGDFEQGVPSD